MNRNKLHLLFAILALVLSMSVPAAAGWIKNEDGSSSYQADNGTVYRSVRKKIGKYYYFFNAEGRMVTKTWVGKRYFKKNGRQAFSAFVGSRYVGSNGKYVTGLKKIKGRTYYFDPETGYMVTDKAVTVDGKTYMFDKDGVSTSLKASVKVEKTYYTDPEVEDEVLLAALIYCEAGNQPYDGQVAVGLVITNRIRSALFPNTLREVVYATDQFTPARNGYLTAALKGKMKVSDSAKKAAAQVMDMGATNSYKITGPGGSKISLKNYLFFMTPAAYKGLGLTAKATVLWDHVFFKTWA